MIKTIAGAVSMTVTLALSAVANAHHSFNMFEMDREVTYHGVVEEYDWRNPHVHLTILVEPGEGVDPVTVGRWDVEGGSTVIMGRQGWNRATYKPGDAITLVGHPLRSGEKGMALFYVIRPDGSRMYHDIARPKDDAAE